MRLFSDASASISDPHLRRAFLLAERGRGTTAPNPMVGCVIVHEGEVVGEGFHERAGDPHAEVRALEAAGERARGSTVYVTLEPCAHHGRTPPCTDALRAAGVGAVIIGTPDTTVEAAGGAEVLRAAGIAVSFAEDPAPFEELNEAWLARSTTGLPWVHVKVATTLDGKVSLAEGVRTAISGPESARITMRLRAAADAVCVGARTAAIDDPALTVRDADGRDVERQPLRIVLARDTVDLTPRLFTDARGPVAVVCHEGALTERLPAEVDLIEYPRADGIRGALSAIAAAGVDRLFIEPGPRLFTALWDEGLVDEFVHVQAGGLGGTDAPGMYNGVRIGTDATLLDAARPLESGVVGDDVVTVWRPLRGRVASPRKEGR